MSIQVTTAGDVYYSYAAAASNDASGGGTVAWTSPSNAVGDSDTVYSTVTTGTSAMKSQRLVAKTFGLSIPASYTVKSITVIIYYNASTSDTDVLFRPPPDSPDYTHSRWWSIRLLKAGVPAGNDKATEPSEGILVRPIYKGSLDQYIGGITGDLWGTTWTATEINNANFGAYVQFEHDAGFTDTVRVDSVYIYVGTNVSDKTSSGGAKAGGTGRQFLSSSNIGTGGAKAGGTASVSLGSYYKGTGGDVAGGTSTHSYGKVISGGIKASGIVGNTITYQMFGGDGTHYIPISISNANGWTGSAADIDEGVATNDGATSYVEGVNPTADFLEVLMGICGPASFNRTLTLKAAVKAQSSFVGFNFLMGLQIGSTNLGSQQFEVSDSSFAVYTYTFTGALPTGNIIAYFAPVETGPTIRISAVELFIDGTGSTLGGESDNNHTILISADPIRTGSSAIVQETVNIMTFGGTATSGTPDVTWIVNFSNPVPVSVGGVAEVQHSYVSNDIGAVLGGNSDLVTFYGVEGGFVAGGQAEQVFIDYVDGEGGSVASGSAEVADLRVYFLEVDGLEVEVGGASLTAVKDWFVESAGEITMGGESDQQMVYHIQYEFLWNLRSAVRKQISLLWNTGQLPIFWYRIIGDVRDICSLDPCCQKMIKTLHARTPAELCQKLKAEKLNISIQSVQRFTRPAENALVTIEHDCNEFEEIELCNIPLCAEFCLDRDLREVFEFSMLVQVDAFKEHIAEGSAYVTGQAVTSYFRDIPSFDYAGEGEIVIEGTATTKESNITGRGGMRAGGTGLLQFSHWEYTGGEWPYETTGVPTAAESLSAESNDQEWAFPEEALFENDEWTQSDISYGQKSEFLIVKNWGFNLGVDNDVLSLTVTINRHSTSINVRDLEVYLMKGDVIISDNLADLNSDWPVFMDSTKQYGPVWRGEEAELHLGVLSAAEINDSEFGLAIRVVNLGNSISIAKIDSVSMSVVYQESDHQTIKIESESTFIAPTYYMTGQGHVTLGSGSTSKVRSNYVYTTESNFEVSGTYETIYNNVGSGGLIVGGEGLAVPYMEQGIGGCSCGGEAEVRPYYEVAVGGTSSGGLVALKSIYRPPVSGGAQVGGFSPVANYGYVTSGGIVMTGDVSIVSSNWYWNSDGNTIFPLGAATTSASDYGTVIETAEFSMTIVDLIVAFDEDKHLGNALPLNDTLSKCGCSSIPLFVNVQHNIDRANKFSQFLARNGYVLPNILKLGFNTTNQSWQRNVHYRGLAPDADTIEVWDFVFELQCTSIVGGEDIGTNIWKFAVDIFRRTGSEDFNTKVWIGVLPEKICNTFSNELVFSIKYNTLSNAANVVPAATIYEAILYDNIGLFKNALWRRNPNLILNISQAALDTVQEKLDLTEIILNG